MRICFITSEFVTEPHFSGGLANYLNRVTTGLATSGHDIHLIVPSSSQEQIMYRGVTVHRVIPVWHHQMWLDRIDRIVPRNWYTVYQNIKAARAVWLRWRSLRQEFDFDIVQIPNCQAIGLFFNKERQIPVVARVSNFRPECDRLTGVKITRPVKKNWDLERKSIQNACSVFTSSHFLANEIQNKWGLPKVSVLEPPFFVEEPEWETKAVGSNKGVYGLYYGGLSQLKGVHILAEALVKTMKTQHKLRFVFIGQDGTSPQGGSMLRYLKYVLRDFLSRVEFQEPMRHRELYSIIKDAKFIATPSLYDNLPNTCLEAMGIGKVVVALRGSCFEQLIKHQESGILADRNVNSLSLGLDNASKLNKKDQSLIEIAAKRRIEKMAPEIALEKLLYYYEITALKYKAKNN